MNLLLSPDTKRPYDQDKMQSFQPIFFPMGPVSQNNTDQPERRRQTVKKKGAPPHSALPRPARTRQEHKQTMPQYGAPTLVHLLTNKLAV